jgi:opacity protein-like surface antigen
MGRSRALMLAATLFLSSAGVAAAQTLGTPAYWDGFYVGIVGGAGSDGDSGLTSLGVVAGTGTTNEAFYFGAEATLAAESLDGDDPYLWLQADGRLGAQVTDTMLLFTSAGVGFDADAQEVALTGGAGAEFTLGDNVALRAQYGLQHYPSGLGTFHEGLAGVVFRFE